MQIKSYSLNKNTMHFIVWYNVFITTKHTFKAMVAEIVDIRERFCEHKQ